MRPRALTSGVAVGTNLSPEWALASGLDDLEAFRRPETMGFATGVLLMTINLTWITQRLTELLPRGLLCPLGL